MRVSEHPSCYSRGAGAQGDAAWEIEEAEAFQYFQGSRRILPKRPGRALRAPHELEREGKGWSSRDTQRNVLVDHELVPENNEGPERHREEGEN